MPNKDKQNNLSIGFSFALACLTALNPLGALLTITKIIEALEEAKNNKEASNNVKNRNENYQTFTRNKIINDYTELYENISKEIKDKCKHKPYLLSFPYGTKQFEMDFSDDFIHFSFRDSQLCDNCSPEYKVNSSCIIQGAADPAELPLLEDKIHVAVDYSNTNQLGHVKKAFPLIIKFIEDFNELQIRKDRERPFIITSFKIPPLDWLENLHSKNGPGKFVTIYFNGYGKTDQLLNFAKDMSKLLTENGIPSGKLADKNEIGRIDIPLNLSHTTYSIDGIRAIEISNELHRGKYNDSINRRNALRNNGIWDPRR